MLFDDQETQRLNAIIKAGAREWTKAEMEDVDAEIQRNKPPGYDDWQAEIRLRYKGNASDAVALAMEKRFPKTHERMPKEALPYLRSMATADAGVYRLPPERTPTDLETGEPQTAEPKLKAFAKLLEGADLDGLAPELERRTIAAKTIFVLPRWFRAPGEAKGGRLILDPYWANDVGVICHRSDPGNFDLCLVLKARLAARSGAAKVEWSALWVRDFVEDDVGQLKSLGVWRVHLVNTKGEYAMAPDDPRCEYRDAAGNALPLPWVLIRLGVASGTVYVDEDRDLIDVVDGLNISRNSRKYTVDMQGFTPVWYAGDEKKEGEIVVGPGDITRIGGGETLNTLQLDPKIDLMQAESELDLNELGRVRRNPAGYANREGQVASGVARQIENEPHEALLDENAHSFRLVEQNGLLPAAVRVHDAFSGNPPIGPCGFRVLTRKPPPPEEPEAKQRRVDADVAAGRISPARGAVELGLYPNEQAAAAFMGPESLKAKPKATTTSPAGPPRFDAVVGDVVDKVQ